MRTPTTEDILEIYKLYQQREAEPAVPHIVVICTLIEVIITLNEKSMYPMSELSTLFEECLTPKNFSQLENLHPDIMNEIDFLKGFVLNFFK